MLDSSNSLIMSLDSSKMNLIFSFYNYAEVKQMIGSHKINITLVDNEGLSNSYNLNFVLEDANK